MPRVWAIALWALLLTCAVAGEVYAQDAVPAGPADNSTTAQALAEEEARQLKLIEQYEREYPDDGRSLRERTETATENVEPTSLPLLLVKMIFTLGAVCLLAYLLLGKLLPRVLRIEPPVAQRRIMQVIDRLPIDQRRSIMVIRIAEQYFLVGASEGGIHLISKLEGDEISGALQAVEEPKPALGRLAGLLLKRRG